MTVNSSLPAPATSSTVELSKIATGVKEHGSPDSSVIVPNGPPQNNGVTKGAPLTAIDAPRLLAPKPLQVPDLEAIYNGQSTPSFTTESPEWRAARQKVIAMVQTSTPASFPGVVAAGDSNGTVASEVSASPSASQVLPYPQQAAAGTAISFKRGTGRPRGRPRGSRGRPRGSRPADTLIRVPSQSRARGNGKRKRGSDDEGATDETDDSENYTPIATVTKSGRNVTKPSQFIPAPAESPDGDLVRKKRIYKKGSEMALCVKCLRGHSTLSNMVVFCDGCNDAFHQWCHDPLIGRDVIDIPEREWFCYVCQGRKEKDRLPLDQRVSGESLTAEEKATYIHSLSSVTLADLLIRAVALHPNLPIFAPDIIQRPAPKRLKLNMTPSGTKPKAIINGTSTPSQTAPSPQPNGHANLKSTPPTSQPETDSQAAPSTASPLPTQPQQSSNPAYTLKNSVTPALNSAPPVKPERDPYPDYSNPLNDPPASYPRPGRGPIKLRSITSRDDMQLLLDENFDVFSHLYNDGKGNLVPLKGSGVHAKGNNEVVRLHSARASEDGASTSPSVEKRIETPKQAVPGALQTEYKAS